MLMLACALGCLATSAADPPPQSVECLAVRVDVGADPDRVAFVRGHEDLLRGTSVPERNSTFTEDYYEQEPGRQGLWRQRIVLHAAGLDEGRPVVLDATVTTSDEGFPAETRGEAQERFPLIRNTAGLSDNRRNNAIYDRKGDWMLEVTRGTVEIHPLGESGGRRQFRIVCRGPEIEFVYRAGYYRQHKAIRFFEPSTYRVWPKSVAGWCSWWPYRADIDEKTVHEISQVFAERLRDYGYEYIQIDDGYQSSLGGKPEDWLTTNDRFPSGLAALAESIRQEGLLPALWVNVHVGDEALVAEHPEWFIRNPDGSALRGNWIDYPMVGSNAEALEEVARPLYRGLREQGWRYVKIDTLRHLLYDGYYPGRECLTAQGTTPEEAMRAWLLAARQTLGRDTYILACWGVLPEAVGLVDACRLGGDGFGPATLAQYNSWNNVVWRNDPDHVDITPEGQEIIRPVLVSMAGAQMLLTDRVEVYRDDRKIEGARRSAPVLWMVPGQLYDFDPTKTDNLIAGLRNQEGGGPAGPIDADQHGATPEWWMLEVDRPFERWNVLARLAWQDLPATTVAFADLGLDPAKRYTVYEFWTKRYLGEFEGSFPVGALKTNGVSVYGIREALDRPQVLATSRHITMGGPDLEDVRWDEGAGDEGWITGESRVVKGDPYTITVRLPGKWELGQAGGSIRIAQTPEETDDYARVTFLPDRTGTLEWTLGFYRR